MQVPRNNNGIPVLRTVIPTTRFALEDVDALITQAGPAPLIKPIAVPKVAASAQQASITHTNQLITIQAAKIAGTEMNAVNARELQKSLGVAKDFSTWMKAQFERARLREHRDYEVFTTPPERGAGNRGARVDYFITIDAAKHIAMMTGTDKGFEVRDYFIDCERTALQTVRPVAKPTISPMMMISTIAAEMDEQSRKLSGLIDQVDSLSVRLDEVARSTKAEQPKSAIEEPEDLTITEAVGVLGIPPKSGFSDLRQDGILSSSTLKTERNQPRQQALGRGKEDPKIPINGKSVGVRITKAYLLSYIAEMDSDMDRLIASIKIANHRVRKIKELLNWNQAHITTLGERSAKTVNEVARVAQMPVVPLNALDLL